MEMFFNEIFLLKILNLLQHFILPISSLYVYVEVNSLRGGKQGFYSGEY